MRLLKLLFLFSIIFLLLTPLVSAGSTVSNTTNISQQFNINGQNDYVVTNQTYIIQTQEYHNPYVWGIVLTLGVIFLVLSNILPVRRGAAVTGFTSSMLILWSAWGATTLDFVTSGGVTSQVLSTGQVRTTIMEIHSVYHDDWLAVILAILFIYSCLSNIFIVMDLRNVEAEQAVKMEGMDEN